MILIPAIYGFVKTEFLAGFAGSLLAVGVVIAAAVFFRSTEVCMVASLAGATAGIGIVSRSVDRAAASEASLAKMRARARRRRARKPKVREDDARYPCPRCAERVLLEANACRFCGAELGPWCETCGDPCEGDPIECSICEAVHHKTCFAESGGCC